MGTTPSPNQSGNRKLTRSQNYVHKIYLNCYHKCKLQSFYIGYLNQRKRQNDLT